MIETTKSPAPIKPSPLKTSRIPSILFPAVIIVVLLSGLFLFIFVNSNSATCRMPDIAEYNSCLAGCNGISDLNQKANCSNTCIGSWSEGQRAYNKCFADELEQDRQKKLEEQKLLE